MDVQLFPLGTFTFHKIPVLKPPKIREVARNNPTLYLHVQNNRQPATREPFFIGFPSNPVSSLPLTEMEIPLVIRHKRSTFLCKNEITFNVRPSFKHADDDDDDVDDAGMTVTPVPHHYHHSVCRWYCSSTTTLLPFALQLHCPLPLIFARCYVRAAHWTSR